MSKYWSDVVKQLVPYIPGEQPKVDNLIKLNTNENPYGPSPKVIEAIKSACTSNLRKYPDPECSSLKQTIADYYNLETAQIFVGNSSDEVLAHTFQALLKQDKPLLFPDITYSFYPVYCGLYEIDYHLVPLTDQFDINLDDYCVENGGVIFANPNAPTGKAVGLESLRSFLSKNTGSVVVVDEAYVDFGGESAITMINEFDNLLVTQTLSKSRSLAGLRVGFAAGNQHLIDALERVKNSFNSYPLDTLAITGAVAAFEDVAYFKETCKKVIDTREWTNSELSKLGFETLESSTNFLFTRHEQVSAKALFEQLREKSILVRHFDKPRIHEYLRITIGTQAEMNQLIKTLMSILSAPLSQPAPISQPAPLERLTPLGDDSGQNQDQSEKRNKEPNEQVTK